MKYRNMLSIAFMIAGWLTRATRDGKITADEWLELLGLLSEELGFPVDFSSFPVSKRANSESVQTRPGV